MDGNICQTRKWCLEQAISASEASDKIMPLAQDFFNFISNNSNSNELKSEETKENEPEIEPETISKKASEKFVDKAELKEADSLEKPSKPKLPAECPKPTNQEKKLTDLDIRMINMIAGYGPEAKVKTATVVENLNMVHGIEIKAPEAGRKLGQLEKLGYLKRSQKLPVSLWTGVKFSDGHPAKAQEPIKKEVKVTKCPPAYATGFGFDQSEIGQLSY